MGNESSTPARPCRHLDIYGIQLLARFIEKSSKFLNFKNLKLLKDKKHLYIIIKIMIC